MVTRHAMYISIFAFCQLRLVMFPLTVKKLGSLFVLLLRIFQPNSIYKSP